jgi:hypothetical protein
MRKQRGYSDLFTIFLLLAERETKTTEQVKWGGQTSMHTMHSESQGSRKKILFSFPRKYRTDSLCETGSESSRERTDLRK